MSFQRSWAQTAERTGIPARLWQLVANAGQAPTSSVVPLPAGGMKPNCVIPNELWAPIADTLRAHAKIPSSVDAPQLAQAAPHLADFREMIFAEVGMTVRDKVAKSLEWFEFKRRSSVDIPSLRKKLKERLSLLERTLAALPPDGHDGTFHVRDTFSRGKDELRALWEERFGNDALRLALAVHVEATQRALARLPTGRTPENVVDNFVQELGLIWSETTGGAPKGSIRDGVEAGPFADFVRAVVALLPDRHFGLDRPIRKVRENAHISDDMSR